MNETLLKPEIQNFINANTGKDIGKLALQKNPFPQIDWREILNQIVAKTKAKDKLPTWFKTDGILYPEKISIEQTSSEKTAIYKATLVSGEKLIDLTGGFGIDDYYFSKNVNSVFHCEINSELSEIVQHNYQKLNAGNIKCFAGDSYEILKDLNTVFDWIYIDPSRRNDAKGKVFLLKDCLPNVPELLDFYLQNGPNVLIKTAPILDITAGLSELKNVKTIHIVAVDNEVKELLWEISKDYNGAVEIKTINILKDTEEKFGFILGANDEAISYGFPKKYLFEPNAAIMKSGGFDEISLLFNLEKLHPFSHLYTSNMIIDFPGRIFEIHNQIPYSKAEMKAFLENQKANITTRNFPDAVETIRKKWKIKDGGNQYCFFTTAANHDKIVLICSKIK